MICERDSAMYILLSELDIDRVPAGWLFGVMFGKWLMLPHG